MIIVMGMGMGMDTVGIVTTINMITRTNTKVTIIKSRYMALITQT